MDWPDVTAPAAWNVIAGGMGQFFAGDFLLGDFSKLYIIDYDTNTFLTVDTTTGAQTAIGPAIPVGGESWTGSHGLGRGNALRELHDLRELHPVHH